MEINEQQRQFSRDRPLVVNRNPFEWHPWDERYIYLRLPINNQPFM